MEKENFTQKVSFQTNEKMFLISNFRILRVD